MVRVIKLPEDRVIRRRAKALFLENPDILHLEDGVLTILTPGHLFYEAIKNWLFQEAAAESPLIESEISRIIAIEEED